MSYNTLLPGRGGHSQRHQKARMKPPRILSISTTEVMGGRMSVVRVHVCGSLGRGGGFEAWG